MNTQRYKLNAPSVVEETFDSETVIVNLVSGYYYSITKSGVAIWNLLLQGYSASEAVTQLRRSFQATEEQLTQAVEEFSAKLLAEQLIAPVNGEATQAPRSSEQSQTPVPFELPILERYTDMQDLLLLGPIHEVDDSGWPNKKQNDTKKS